MGVMTLGGIASFLQLSRSFVHADQPGHAADLTSIIMAMAGASRIFSLLDDESEKDEGYVTLVNAEREGRRAHRDRRSTPAFGHGSIRIRTAP